MRRVGRGWLVVGEVRCEEGRIGLKLVRDRQEVEIGYS